LFGVLCHDDSIIDIVLDIILLPVIRSLERRARYLFYCMFFLFVRFLSTISRQPAARFTPNFACVRILWFRMCLLPFWGSAAPGGRKRGNEMFVSIGVNGEFRQFLSDISATQLDKCINSRIVVKRRNIQENFKHKTSINVFT